MTDIRTKINKHSKFVAEAFLWILWLTAATMFVILIVGICKIFIGGYSEIMALKSINENSGIIDVLKGLEFVFIAPLLYILVLSLVKYISAVSPGDGPDELNAGKMYINYAIMEIVNVKILIIGVFISVLVLHSLTLILENTSSDPPIIFIASLLVILIIYYVVLDKLIEKFRE